MKRRKGETGASPGAIVIGGDYRGLGVVRSLGRQGIPVWVLTDEHYLAARSRYCRRSFAFPNSGYADQERFLIELGTKHGLKDWALIPTGDETAALISSRHESLSKIFTLTTPSPEVFRWAYDKKLSHELADRCAVAHPRTWHPTVRDHLASFDIPFPAILKPAFKTTLNPFTIKKAWRVESREDLLAKYDEASAHTEPDAIMVQEIISGGGDAQLSFAALVDDGRVLASITARRTRQYPMDFGRASTFVETIEDSEVETASRRLLAEMHASGLIEVEFKRDPRDKQLKLLDINPRVWGWHSIGCRAGVDFPYLLWRHAFGLPVTEVHATAGVRWVRGLTDFPTVMKELRAGRMKPLDYLRSIRPPAEWALVAADDLVPAVIEIPYTIRIALRRGELKSDLIPAGHQELDQGLPSSRPSKA
jgi:D-aspartate ligase